MSKSGSDFERKVAAKERRRLAARRGQRSVWFGLGMFGVIGWSVVVPALAGVAFGWWLDRRWESTVSWALTFLLLGVVLGCFNAWRWIEKEHRDG